MIAIFKTMYTFLQSSKMEGSYLLLFAISIFVLYSVNKQRNKWLLMYPVLLLVFVVANPVTVWVLSRVFPVIRSYEPLTVLLPILIYIPFAITELLSGMKSAHERSIVAIVLFVFISLSGNLMGVFGGDTMTEANTYNEEKATVVSVVDEKAKKCVIADEDMVPFINAYGDNVPMLYGQDLWTPGMDLGIMDEYDEDIINLCFMMREPEKYMDEIIEESFAYGCDIIITKKFEGARISMGPYVLDTQTDNYLIYRLRTA